MITKYFTEHWAGEWIPHKPGDPMPVDDNTLVSCRLKNNQETSIRPAAGFDWGDYGGGYNITAYRIHKPEITNWALGHEYKQKEREMNYKHPLQEYANEKKEREMKYKKGDKITIVLDDEDVAEFNQGSSVYAEIKIRPQQIIAHEPAPEPIVGYVYYDDSGVLPFKGLSHTTERKHQIRITYNPATKEVKAEIVQ